MHLQLCQSRPPFCKLCFVFVFASCVFVCLVVFRHFPNSLTLSQPCPTQLGFYPPLCNLWFVFVFASFVCGCFIVTVFRHEPKWGFNQSRDTRLRCIFSGRHSLFQSARNPSQIWHSSGLDIQNGWSCPFLDDQSIKKDRVKILGPTLCLQRESVTVTVIEFLALLFTCVGQVCLVGHLCWTSIMNKCALLLDWATVPAVWRRICRKEVWHWRQSGACAQ